MWTDKQQAAFELLKDELCEEPLLERPDFNKPLILTTDASRFAIGGILSQGEIGKDKPISYVSRALNIHEVKYDTYNKEALAIVFCVTHFKHYLYGRKFKIVTDHKPLIWFQNSSDPCSRVTRWKLKLSEYDFEMVYKGGKMNVNADLLSRNPVEAIVDNEEEKEEINHVKEDLSGGIPEEILITEEEHYEEDFEEEENFNEEDNKENIDLRCYEEVDYETLNEPRVAHAKSKSANSTNIFNSFIMIIMSMLGILTNIPEIANIKEKVNEFKDLISDNVVKSAKLINSEKIRNAKCNFGVTSKLQNQRQNTKLENLNQRNEGNNSKFIDNKSGNKDNQRSLGNNSGESRNLRSIVPGCESRGNVQSHGFPKDFEVVEEWLKVICSLANIGEATLRRYSQEKVSCLFQTLSRRFVDTDFC